MPCTIPSAGLESLGVAEEAISEIPRATPARVGHTVILVLEVFFVVRAIVVWEVRVVHEECCVLVAGSPYLARECWLVEGRVVAGRPVVRDRAVVRRIVGSGLLVLLRSVGLLL